MPGGMISSPIISAKYGIHWRGCFRGMTAPVLAATSKVLCRSTFDKNKTGKGVYGNGASGVSVGVRVGSGVSVSVGMGVWVSVGVGVSVSVGVGVWVSVGV